MRVSFTTVVLVVALAGVASPRRVEATCADPQPVLSVPSGATLPLRADLYLFVPPSDTRVLAFVDGLPAELDRVKSGNDLALHRLRFRRGAPRRVSVVFELGRQRIEAEYQLVPQPAQAPDRAVTLDAVGVLDSGGFCSRSHALMARPSIDAPLYRVEWATSEGAWRRGRRSHTWIPRHPAVFGGLLGAGHPEEPELALGYLGCLGETLPAGVVDGGLYVGVVAVFADGSETPLPRHPRFLGPWTRGWVVSNPWFFFAVGLAGGLAWLLVPWRRRRA